MKIEKGYVAVVTGGASGIGLALATELVRREVCVAIADIEKCALDVAIGELDVGGLCEAFICDVAKAESVIALRDFTLKTFGQIDLVFNNAGVVLAFEPMWTHSLVDWSWLMGVNLGGVIHGVHAFVPHLVAQGRGHIVNTASMAGVSVIPNNGPYNAAKHAVISITESLAAELEHNAPNVHASVLCPGLVPTRIRFAARNRSGHQPPESTSPPPSIAADQERHTVSANVVAQRTLQGVEENRTYIFTNPGSADVVRSRFAAIEKDLLHFS